MSLSELALLEQARPDVGLLIVERTPGRVAFAAGPCPLLSEDGSCSVYAVRPYRCRVYGCFRTEAQYADGVGPVAELLTRRVGASAGVRRVWGRMVEEAEAWGRDHGWVESVTDGG